MHIVVPNYRVLGLAGFYDSWMTYAGKQMHAFTILTAPCSGAMSQWLPRVPIILDEDGIADWLNPQVHEYRSLRKHLEPMESYRMHAYPVTNAVSDDAYESPDCIREIRPDFA